MNSYLTCNFCRFFKQEKLPHPRENDDDWDHLDECFSRKVKNSCLKTERCLPGDIVHDEIDAPKWCPIAKKNKKACFKGSKASLYTRKVDTGNRHVACNKKYCALCGACDMFKSFELEARYLVHRDQEEMDILINCCLNECVLLEAN